MKLPNRTASSLRPGIIAPRVAIVAGILVCFVSLYFLTPSRTALLKRHLQDGDERSAALLLAEADGGNTDQLTAALTTETIRICERDGWKGSSLNMLTSFLRRNKNPEPAAQEALRHVDRIPAEARAAVMGALVSRALSDGNLGMAQELQTRLIESAENLTPEMVRQAVTTYRYNSNPALAKVTIDQLEKQRGSLPDDLREMRIKLVRELSQPEIAFALLSQRVRATEDPAELRRLIPGAVKTGIEAGRQKDLIPLYEKYLQIVKVSGGATDPLTTEYALNLAQTYEWTKQPSKAFDAYVDLAARGNRKALDRCVALNPGLFRQEDLMKALVAGYEYYHEDDKLLLLTARYLGESALREEAIRYYQEYLERNPTDAEAHFRLGAVYDEAVQLENALTSFHRAYELTPDNNTYLAKVARLSTTLRLYDKALGYLRTLSKRTKNRDHVEQYYTLANGLGDMVSIKDSLRLLIDIGGRLSPSNYIYLASAYREEGDLAGHLKILKEALKKHPRNPFIRLDLANAHLFERRPDRALDVLQNVNLAHYPQGAQVGLNALITLDNSPYGGSGASYLGRFGSQLEESEDLSPKEVLQFGEYCKQHGSASRARRLFHRVVESATDPGQLARAHFHLNEFRTALGFHLKHIETSPLVTSNDYQLLGDIYAKLGQSSSKRSAYQKALSLLKKRTAKPQNR